MSKHINVILSDNTKLNEFLSCGFVIQKPQTEEIWLGYGEGESQDPSFYLSPFYCNKFEHFNCKEVVKTDLKTLILWAESHFQQQTKIKSINNSDNDFLRDVHQMVDWIKNNTELKKLVGVTNSDYEFIEKEHPISKIKNLAELNGSLYGMWKDGSGFIGASPEPLFVKDLDKWKTRALAGTISTNLKNFKEILKNDPKEVEEHNLVISDIKNKLTPYSNQINIEDTTCIKFGDIAHLQTEISFETKEPVTSENLIDFLSPTAALGGYPDELVYDYLQKLNYYQLEKDNRVFGGVFGIDIPGESFSLVAIRNVFWTTNKMTIHSGCGVVENSIPANEMKEVQNKRAVIERIFI